MTNEYLLLSLVNQFTSKPDVQLLIKCTTNMDEKVLNNFKEIVFEKPSDIIINQIKNLIISGELKPKQKLPSERKLSEKLSVSRSAVRDAIKKLEFYGILKTQPQSGTVVAGIGVTALKGLISDILNVNGSDFRSLVETRVILEINAAKLAAERRDEHDVESIKSALQKYRKKIENGASTVDEDMLFHLKIAEASKNSVLKSLMMVIIPDIISNYMKLKVCSNDSFSIRIKEHEEILQWIIKKNPEKAGDAMQNHLGDIKKFSVMHQFSDNFNNI